MTNQPTTDEPQATPAAAEDAPAAGATPAPQPKAAEAAADPKTAASRKAPVAAMAEGAEGTDAAVPVGSPRLRPLAPKAPAGVSLDLEQLMDIPVTLAVELGRVKLSLDRVTRLAPGALVELPRASTDPVDVLVNGTPVARAEVVTVGEQYGIRIVELVSPEDRVKGLGGR